MTDLIKFLRTSTSSAYNKVAADRIEELNERLTAATDDAKEAEAYAEELEARIKELTLQLLAVHGQAADALDKAVVAEAKLTKAVELALEECPFRAGTPKYDKWWHHRRDVLAALEKRND